MKYFDRVWGLLTRRAVNIDAFKADVTLYYKEDDRLNSELVDRIQDVVQWAKASHKGTHGQQTYETLCTAVVDWQSKEDGGRVA
ncbi:hypothetical protein VYU27_010221 [Nannochloropsis oceanica]